MHWWRSSRLLAAMDTREPSNSSHLLISGRRLRFHLPTGMDMSFQQTGGIVPSGRVSKRVPVSGGTGSRSAHAERVSVQSQTCADTCG